MILFIVIISLIITFVYQVMYQVGTSESIDNKGQQT